MLHPHHRDWYRKYFNQQPLKLEPSMSAPVVPLDKQTQQNKTVSQFYCPARDFAYSCRLDKQYFEQVLGWLAWCALYIGLTDDGIHTNTHQPFVAHTDSSQLYAQLGLELWRNDKDQRHVWHQCTRVWLQHMVALSLVPKHTCCLVYHTNHSVGGGAGPVFQFSFSYSFQDGTASAHTEQETTVEVRACLLSAVVPLDTAPFILLSRFTPQSVAIQVPANATKCLLITTKLATVSATGTQNVYINASNYIGTHQGSAHHWSAVDTDPKETHYYRLFSIPYMVQLAKRLGIPEAAAWTISPDGQFASITTTIDHSFNLATVGSTTFNTWYDSTSIDCTRWDPGHALLRAEGPVGQHVTQDGRTLPVYNAVRVG